MLLGLDTMGPEKGDLVHEVLRIEVLPEVALEPPAQASGIHFDCRFEVAVSARVESSSERDGGRLRSWVAGDGHMRPRETRRGRARP